MEIKTLYQQDWYFSNGDVSCGNGFINIHSLYQYNDSITFNIMYGFLKIVMLVVEMVL